MTRSVQEVTEVSIPSRTVKDHGLRAMRSKGPSRNEQKCPIEFPEVLEVVRSVKDHGLRAIGSKGPNRVGQKCQHPSEKRSKSPYV